MPTLRYLLLWPLLIGVALTTGSEISRAAEKVAPAPTAGSRLKKIGVTAGDFAKLTKEFLKPALEKKSYKIEIVEFTDYVQPNLALVDGRIDLNIFQHRAFLESFLRERHVDLEAVVPVPTAPLGLYAGKTKSLAALRAGGTVAIPNDPTNQARALRMLSDLGWIAVNPKVDAENVSIRDIVKNPKKVVLIQLEAAQLTGALQDVDLAVINGNFIVSRGLLLSSALVREKSAEFINWAVARGSERDSDFVKDVKSVLGSDAFKKYTHLSFKDYQFPADWK